MLWLKLGWRNLWRNRRRTIIELTSIAGSVALAVFMNNLAVGSYGQMVNDGVRMGSGHIGIYHTDYLELQQLELTFEAGPIIQRIGELPEVMAVYPRLHVPGLIRSSRENRPAGIIGLDFEREKDDNPLLKIDRYEQGGLPETGDERGAVMGVVLADELAINLGKKFVIMAQGSDGDIASELFRVRGVFSTNARDIDANTLMIARENVARVLGKPGEVHEIAVMLEHHDDIEKVLPKIRAIVADYENVDAYPWQEAMSDMANAIQMDHVGLLIIVVFMYILVGIGTINTLLMSVMERTREFGVLRAIGLNGSGIRKIVFAEAFVLAVSGVMIGMLIAIGGCIYTTFHGIDYSAMLEDQSIAGTMFEPIIYSGWDVPAMMWMGVAMIILALAASLYPVHRIMKMNPSQAMRSY